MPRFSLRKLSGAVALPATGAPGVTFTTTPGANSITFETWVRITPALLAGTHALATFENTAYSTGFLISQNGNDLILYKPNGGGGPSVTYTNAFANYLGKWIHLVVVFTLNGGSSTAQAFINGVGLTAQGGLAAWNLGSGTLGLGGSVDGFNASAGNYAGTRFYLRALSAQDVSDRYYLGRDDAAMRTSLLVAWDFAEQTGTTTADGSGNGNTGTLVSGATWSTDVPMKSRTALATGQNFFTWSTDVTNAAWIIVAQPLTKTGGQADPFGGTAACRLTDSANTGTFRISQALGSNPKGAFVTFSVYAKQGTKRWIELADSTTGLGAWFDLQNGVLGTVNAGATATIQAVGGGWYLCTLTQANYQLAMQPMLFMTNSDATISYTGDGTGTVLIAYPQLVQANWAGPLAPTGASAITAGQIRSTTSTVQNFLKWSTVIDGTHYIDSSANVTVATGQADPFGGTTGSQLTDTNDGAGAQHQLNQNVPSALANMVACASVYVKAGTTNPQFAIAPNGAAVQVLFDTSVPSITLVNNSDGSYISSGMQATGNGWYRCWVVYKPTPGFLFLQFYLAKAGALVYQGNGAGVSVIAGPQLVAGNAPGPYAQTTSASIINTGSMRWQMGPQNLLLWSEAFANAAWTKTQCTAADNNATAPDGTVTACLFLEDNTNNSHVLQQASVVVTGQQTFTFSARFKQGTRRYVVLRVGTSAGYEATFDLQTGTVTNTSGATATITPDAQGFYYCAITFTPAAGTMTHQIALSDTTGAYHTYQGATSNNVLVWGAQVQYGNAIGPYVRTTQRPFNIGATRSKAA